MSITTIDYILSDINTDNCIHVHVQALDEYSEQPDILYGLFMHEIIHALGFSSRLFDK